MTATRVLSRVAVAVSMALAAAAANADAVTDWNAKANELLLASRLGPPPANRAVAIAQVATFEAVNAITRRYPATGLVTLQAAPGASKQTSPELRLWGSASDTLMLAFFFVCH